MGGASGESQDWTGGRRKGSVVGKETNGFVRVELDKRKKERKRVSEG